MITKIEIADKNSIKKLFRTIEKEMISCIRKEGANGLKKMYAQQIKDNRQDDGSKMPEKKPSTKRQYKRNRWDTKHFLKRTGASVRIKRKSIPRGVRLYANDTNGALKYHVKNAKGADKRARVYWMSGNVRARSYMIQILGRRLKRWAKM